MTRRQVNEALLDAKKSLGALATLWAAAVPLGLVDSATAGWVTTGLGAATAAVVYVLDNEPSPRRISRRRARR